jgi:LmbE family N-acetylglucosaminyl deacetylase
MKLRLSRCALLAGIGVLMAAMTLGAAAQGVTQKKVQPAVLMQAAVILEELRHFRQMGTVLFVAAHPDDENNNLITYLARGKGYRTAYLSLTRGDGGQNVLGSEFGEALGAIRTQELLAARRADGGRQFFTRAIDFGFSKDYKQTLTIWDKDQVVSDIVRVIRRFRPDVVITRFSPEPGGTHGHHTASAVLALEAFRLCGDPKNFPEQVGELGVWQPRRIVMNSGFGRGGKGGNVIQIETDGADVATGESFGAIAGRARSMHKSQGFGNFGGGGKGGGGRTESFTLLDGKPATKDLFEGVDTTWGRIPGGAEIGTMVDAIIENYDAKELSKNVPALLELRKRLLGLESSQLVDEKRQTLDRIILRCAHVSWYLNSPGLDIVPGEEFSLTARTEQNPATTVAAKWTGMRFGPLGTWDRSGPALPEDRDGALGNKTKQTLTLPINAPLSHPYWLRKDGTEGMFRVDDAKLIGMPENPPPVPVEFVFELGGQKIIVPDAVNLRVVPPVSLRFASNVELFAPGATRSIAVELATIRKEMAGTVQLDVPTGWNVEPQAQPFRLAAVGDKATFSFNVTAPAQAAVTRIGASVKIGDARYDTQRTEIKYPHIPPILLLPQARFKAICLDVATRGHKVGYVPGAGDSVGDCLKQLGYDVTNLEAADLTAEGLKGFDAVVIGVRAFNTRTDLAPKLPALFAFVENGGNLIVQYNTANGLKTSKFAPYAIKLSSERVTDKQAKITFLAPDHPVLNGPNKITAADFDGWVQERGIYFPNEWDKEFTPILACNDPGAPPLRSGILVAKHGRGYFVYSGMSWFRQLPAGVPGAYRVFANMVSLGK